MLALVHSCRAAWGPPPHHCEAPPLCPGGAHSLSCLWAAAGDRSSVGSTDSVGSTRSAGSGQSTESSSAPAGPQPSAGHHDNATQVRHSCSFLWVVFVRRGCELAAQPDPFSLLPSSRRPLLLMEATSALSPVGPQEPSQVVAEAAQARGAPGPGLTRERQEGVAAPRWRCTGWQSPAARSSLSVRSSCWRGR